MSVTCYVTSYACYAGSVYTLPSVTYSLYIYCYALLLRPSGAGLRNAVTPCYAPCYVRKANELTVHFLGQSFGTFWKIFEVGVVKFQFYNLNAFRVDESWFSKKPSGGVENGLVHQRKFLERHVRLAVSTGTF